MARCPTEPDAYAEALLSAAPKPLRALLRDSISSWLSEGDDQPRCPGDAGAAAAPVAPLSPGESTALSWVPVTHTADPHQIWWASERHVAALVPS